MRNSVHPTAQPLQHCCLHILINTMLSGASAADPAAAEGRLAPRRGSKHEGFNTCGLSSMQASMKAKMLDLLTAARLDTIIWSFKEGTLQQTWCG